MRSFTITRSSPITIASSLLFALAGGAGCTGAAAPGAKPSCAQHFLGDPAQPPALELVVGDGITPALRAIADDDAVPLMRPPQGGQVSYVGARVTNVDACSLQLTGRYLDPTSGEILGFDGRTIDLTDDGGGWGVPDGTAAHLANVNACPDYGTEDIVNQQVTLAVGIVDAGGRSASASVRVVPSCDEQADEAARALCRCECTANYTLGACGGGTDGGAPR